MTKRTFDATRTMAVGLLIAIVAAGCGNRMDTQPLVASSIEITTPSGTTGVGGTIRFSATVSDAGGNPINLKPTWSVVNGGGTIDSAGLFTAGDSVGTFENTIVATSGSASATSSVVVTSGPLASIILTPDTTTLAIGATQQYTAVGHDSSNNVVPLSPTWSTSGGGTINDAGLFTAGTVAGTFANTVTVTSGNISAHASVTIVPGGLASITVAPATQSLATGATQLFTAVGRDSNNNVVPITPTWNAVASGGTINSTTGVFTAGAVAGTFTNTVRAQVGFCSSAIFGYASVTVTPGALATIAISPPSTSLLEGATQQFTATGADANGNAVAITPVWSVVGSGGGTIGASTGLYTAGSVPGTYTNTVLATVSSLASLASVTITAPVAPLSTIEITPANPSLFGQQSEQFTATGYDAGHNVVPITGTLTWSLSTSQSIGTIDPSTGLFQFNGGYNGNIANAISVTNGTITAYTSLTLDCGC